MHRIAPYLKSLTAALVAGLGVLALALDDGLVTAGEWVNISIAFLTALGAVWAIPNKDPKAQHQGESVQPAGGYYDPSNPDSRKILGKAVMSPTSPRKKEQGISAVHVLLIVFLVVAILALLPLALR